MCKWRTAVNYLAGLVAGDGSIYYYKRNNEYFTYVYDNNKDFLEQVGREIAGLLKVSYTVVKPSKNKRYYRLQFTSKKIYELVAERLEKRVKNPTKSFIRGIIDAEGSLYTDRGRIVLQIGLTDKKLAEATHRWLNRHGIRATLVEYRDRRGRRKTLYKIYVRGWDNVEKVINEVKPRHPKIKDKFEMLKSLRERGTPP